jgi:hypothetical protein
VENIRDRGEMAERLNAPVLKTGNGATCSGVQIPLSPPLQTIKNKKSPRKRKINKNKQLTEKASEVLSFYITGNHAK